MNTTSRALLAAGLSLSLQHAPVHAQKVAKNPPPRPAEKQPPPPPPVYLAPPESAPYATGGSVYVYDQKPAQGRPPLVTPEQAQSIIDQFRNAYQAMGQPRLLIYVNRELVDESSGLKMIARVEKSETTDKIPREPNSPPQEETKKTSENRYRNSERPAPTLADKQTVRDLERLFGRPLRMGGASLADQRLATQLLASKPFEPLRLEGEQARKDREAIGKIADVVIEILISSKEVRAPSFNGERVYTVPDIQATAIRLPDARIIGQASTSDLYGGEPSPALARYYSVQAITEATALALMEDMTLGYQPAIPTPDPDPAQSPK